MSQPDETIDMAPDVAETAVDGHVRGDGTTGNADGEVGDQFPIGDGHEPDGHDPGFEELLVFLRERRGFDFTGYKRPSLLRRVRRRMNEVGITSMAGYQDF